FTLEAIEMALDAGGDLVGVELEQERAVRQHAADGREIEIEDPGAAELTPGTLVRDGRVDVPIAENRRSAVERGTDHVVDKLGTRVDVEQRLGPRADVPTV